MNLFKRLIFIVLIVFFISACRRNESSLDVFRYNENAGILTLDPAFAKDLPHIWACNQLYNGLVELDSSMMVKPSLAKRWTISEDGLTYTFYLRNDVTFHDHPAFDGKSRKLIASDFVFSFNRFLDEKLASPGIWIFNQVQRKNAVLDVTALNDTILQIGLIRPFPAFLGLLGMAYASAVPKEVVMLEGNNFRRNPCGTGPFHFKFWEEGVRLVLRRNQHYFEIEDGKQLPFLEAVSVSFLTDRQTAFMEFIKGNLDFMSGIDARYKDELLTRQGMLRSKYLSRISLQREPFLNTEYLGFFIGSDSKAAQSPQKQKALRQAINYGIDREKMLKYLRNNIGVPGHGGMIPKGLPGYDVSQTIGYRFDLERAKSLIEANDLKGSAIKISVTADYVDLVKYVQSQLDQLGLEVKVEVMPTATLRELRAFGKLDVFRASWVADYPDGENYLSLFYHPNQSPSGPNYTHFNDKNFDRMFEKSYSVTDPAERAELYRQMDSMVMEQAPVVVLYYDEVLRFIHKNVKGLAGNPSNQLDLKRVYKLN